MKKIYTSILSCLLCALPLVVSAQLGEVTDITLTFTPVDGGDPVIAEALDTGTGLEVVGDVELQESTEYSLSMAINNGDTDLDTLIAQSAEDYLFFFGFTEGIFASPDGNGNIDNREDPVNYDDADGSGQPLGLATSWTTDCVEELASGTLRIVLQYQPDNKSATSTVEDGTTQWDLTWNVSVINDPAAPPCENEEEIITDVTLTFTSEDSTSIVTTTAQDPDGEGPLGLEVTGTVELLESTVYTLAIELRNEIEGEDITEEIREEDDEHMFFFAWNDEIFDSPDGNGNIDNRDDPVNYNDADGNGLPVGLSTSWTTACTEADTEGSLLVVLKHQPDIKSATSTAEDGGTDLDIEWPITIIDDPNAPPCENEEEIITDVVLSFIPVAGGDTIQAIAQDPDGEGPLGLEVAGDVELLESTEYMLMIELRNEIEGEDITEEIEEEDDEHMFFFAFDESLFERPDGDGNIDNRDDPVNYNDEDENGFPVGLSTSWTTSCIEEANATGNFRVVLKHQPDIKSATSTSEDGGTDLDVDWTIIVVDDPAAPPCENEEEIITDAVLSFIPVAGGDTIQAIAQDPDGEGPLGLEVAGDAELLESTEYMLMIELSNEIEGEDITEEIEEEDDEHMFFFAFDESLFERPDGDGNIDNRDDPVNYKDEDENGFPVGLSTSWTTSCIEEANATGNFRVVLKHQPDIKSATSTAEDGGTDLDIEWTITVVDDPAAPPCENEEEIITDVVITFTSEDSSSIITATAQDPDGEGPLDLEITEDISLLPNTTYTLSLALSNEIEGEDITEEIEEEDEEHMFFFGWTEGLFADPTGDGNIDNRDDPVNYNDEDENGLPVGLSTTWTTGDSVPSGTFRIVLKHQPDLKSASTTVDDGGTDLDLTWNIGEGTPTSLVDKIEKTGLTLWPNPARDQINWSVEGVEIEELRVYDQMGRLIHTQKRPETSMNTRSLSAGTYLLMLVGNQQIWRERVVIVK